MSKLEWDKTGERLYHLGVDHGVVFPMVKGKYTTGAPWNGLTAVNESPDAQTPTTSTPTTSSTRPSARQRTSSTPSRH